MERDNYLHRHNRWQNFFYLKKKQVFAGSINLVKSCGLNISANVRDGALSNKIKHITYFFFVDSKSRRASKMKDWCKSYSNFAELV